MTQSIRRFVVTFACLNFACVLPGVASAQPPVYLTQWAVGIGFNGLATDAAGDVYVVDAYNSHIMKFTGTGSMLTQWGMLGSNNGEFEGPLGVATSAAGDVYVSDQINGIQVFTGTGTFLARWGSYGNGPGEFYFPLGLAVDAAGEVYIADTYNNRIQKFGPGQATPVKLATWGSLKERFR